ncbi:hypothetical protein FG379_001816 [Cryptosporidium bovis]|uniref:uncharacterized protein n=1 Tax=Cryptosporidium bovis TaxID=310047 RepID=UPI00351A071C|nr:hypothetical protein FG379_001816 [Cryptosporidium bovis]
MSGYNVNRYTVESRKFHKSEQRGHLKLKYRREDTEGSEEKKDSVSVKGFNYLNDEDKGSNVVDFAERECDNQSDNSDNEILIVDDSNGNVDEDELDEDEELLLELEKIKKERKEKEKEKNSNKIKLMMKNNPLLDLPRDEKEIYNRTSDDNEKDEDYDDYVLKRSWMDDTVFKNQHRYKEKKKRFINDTLHNDFHKEFMKKYII